MENQRLGRFQHIFEIALVLLGVLSATENQYFAKIWGDTIALRFTITPFILIIAVWLLKELFSNKLSIAESLLFSEFCWELWSLTLTYYLLFFWLYSVPSIPLLAFIEATIFGLMFYSLICVAYWFEFKNEAVEYYKNKKWILKRVGWLIVGVIVIYIIFYI